MLCRELLELVLDRKVGELACVNRQKPVEITANGKGVRFDVYAEGSDSIIYDIEMQNAVSDSIAKRSRYSQGMIDLNLMNRGAHYNELNRSYVIYICRFNLFEEIGRHFWITSPQARQATASQTNWKMKCRKPAITSNGGQSI